MAVSLAWRGCSDRRNGKKLLVGDWTPVAGRPNPPGQTLGHHSVLTATGKLQAVVLAHQHRLIIRAHICAHVILPLDAFAIIGSAAAKHRDLMSLP